MNQGTGSIHLSIALCLLLDVLCMASFVGCTNNNIIPASKIANAYGKVTLTWSNAPGALSYNIYFSRTAELTKWNSHIIPNASNPITITDVALGKIYYFGISLVDASGESGILSEKSYTATGKEGMVNFGELVPGIQNSKAQDAKVQLQEGQVTLSWDDVPHAVSYNIYYSDSPGVTKLKGKKIANVMHPYTIKGLKQGRIYYFVVTAVTNSGESKESEELSFTVK